MPNENAISTFTFAIGFMIVAVTSLITTSAAGIKGAAITTTRVMIRIVVIAAYSSTHIKIHFPERLALLYIAVRQH